MLMPNVFFFVNFIEVVAQMVKNLLAVQETWVWYLGWEDPLEKGMATHSRNSCLESSLDKGVWGRYNLWGHKEVHEWATNTFTFIVSLQCVLIYSVEQSDSVTHTHTHTHTYAAAAARSLQCPTLCDPIDSSPPGSPIPGTLQARTLEWVAISFSSAWKWKVKVKSLSRVPLLATPWTAAHQAPPSMGSSRQSTGVGCYCLLRYIYGVHIYGGSEMDTTEQLTLTLSRS